MDTKEMQNNKHDKENTDSVQMQVLGVKLAATCGYLRKRGWDVCWGGLGANWDNSWGRGGLVALHGLSLQIIISTGGQSIANP